MLKIKIRHILALAVFFFLVMPTAGSAFGYDNTDIEATKKNEIKDIPFDNEPEYDSSENLKSTSENRNKEDVAIPQKKSLDEISPENFADIVVLQGLDKVTAKSSYLKSKVGDVIKFKRLEIYPIKCWEAPPTEKPENKVLLKIYENQLNGKRKEIFYGWMFSSSPALSTLEHPIYDVTVVECKFSEEAEEKNEEQ